MNSKSTIVTAILVILVGAGAFYGGTIYEKSSLTAQGLLRTGNRMGLGNNGAGGQSGGQQRSGAMRQGGGFTSGNITAKDDKSITVQNQDGSSKIIYFSDTTFVGKADKGSISDLTNGQQIMVNGKSNPDGSITAENIQIRPDQPQQ